LGSGSWESGRGLEYVLRHPKTGKTVSGIVSVDAYNYSITYLVMFVKALVCGVGVTIVR